MPFIRSFLAAVIIACALYYASMLALIDAPVPAEYWVNEMLAVKKELVKSVSGKRKIIIAGGSSTLFGIDAEYASQQLNMPVINFGLHAGLRLEKILNEAGSVLDPDDYLILHLEPPYYDCHKELNSWQIRNFIAWDHESWSKLNRPEKIKFFFSISPSLYLDMFISGLKRQFYPASVKERTAALNQSATLSRFRSRTLSYSSFSYSANQLNDHGDLQAAIGSNFRLQSRDARKPNHICGDTKTRLKEFADRLKKDGVRVYFANTPYIDWKVDKSNIDRSEFVFLREISPIGCLIDRRRDLFFDKRYFFNSNLHLNVEGRRIRTKRLIDAIRNRVLSGECE
ncbi:MAG: hypothetical protein ACU841_00285 [Gammaproteobacteria bacterium]